MSLSTDIQQVSGSRIPAAAVPLLHPPVRCWGTASRFSHFVGAAPMHQVNLTLGLGPQVYATVVVHRDDVEMTMAAASRRVKLVIDQGDLVITQIELELSGDSDLPPYKLFVAVKG